MTQKSRRRIFYHQQHIVKARVRLPFSSSSTQQIRLNNFQIQLLFPRFLKPWYHFHKIFTLSSIYHCSSPSLEWAFVRVVFYISFSTKRTNKMINEISPFHRNGLLYFTTFFLFPPISPSNPASRRRWRNKNRQNSGHMAKAFFEILLREGEGWKR